MFTTILVPLDGSALAERAIPYAEALARPSNARLALVRAETSGITGSRVIVTHEALAYLERIAVGLRARGLTVRTSAPYSAPASGVIAEAHRLEADLIVLVSHGRSGFGHLAYGSVAEEILSRATSPVLLVSAQTASQDNALPTGEVRLLVPLDGSSYAEAALPAARDLALALGGSIVLLEALPEPDVATRTNPAVDWAEVHDALRSQELDELTYLRAVAAQDLADVATMSVVRAGAPAAVIATASRDYGATMVVMATHGRQGLGRYFFGSVAAEALHTVGVPFLLVGPSAEIAVPPEEVQADAPNT